MRDAKENREKKWPRVLLPTTRGPFFLAFLSRHARRTKREKEYFAVFFRDTHDGQSERRTTSGLQITSLCWKGGIKQTELVASWYLKLPIPAIFFVISGSLTFFWLPDKQDFEIVSHRYVSCTHNHKYYSGNKGKPSGQELYCNFYFELSC